MLLKCRHLDSYTLKHCATVTTHLGQMIHRLSYAISLQYQQSLSPQPVCNQGNHSVVKQPISFYSEVLS